MHLLFTNRAACFLKLLDPQSALDDCNRALELEPTFVKAFVRRSQAYEQLGNMEAALKEIELAISAAGPSAPAFLQRDLSRLKDVVANKHEQEKQEMLGKLKDLGNMVLGKVGLSLDNFKVNQDPQTGSYSIQFKQ